MSQKKAQLLNPLNGNLNVSGVVTASSFVGGLTGSVTGNVTGTASTAQGLSGSPNITVGSVTATSGGFSGNVIVGVTTIKSGEVEVVGVVTATTVKAGAAISITDGAVSATRFHGDGSALTGIESWNQQDTWLYGGG